ncbi:hypothetical protein [Halobellus rarus]|uniref:KTSC domain-containing protein n=1 Tax=Halobellus rarus TaxID=1126237 RepID=A0ABD6CS09_9EURY|nr:hypothetical protein [Halobellus rarus]
MSSVPPNPSEASLVRTIESDDVGSVTLIVFDDRKDSRVVVDGGTDTWEFVVNEEVAYSRWEHGELPEWMESALSQIGIRAIRAGEANA